jgi:triosephosphate isomerase
MPNLNSKILVLANWKVNLSLAETLALVKKLLTGVAKLKGNFELGLCPTFPALPGVAKLLQKKKVLLGAQNVFWKPNGPYTGEISPSVLRELGVKYVIVGHSERRQYLKETDIMIRQKIAATLAEGLTPVLCVGETFAERQAGQKDIVVARQISAALTGITLSPGHELVIAYEPVWVIGSGRAVAPEEAFYIARVIRQSLIDIFSTRMVDSQIKIIYGGSVNTSNIASFVGRGKLGGVLVGGASLEAKSFLALLKQL